MNDTVKLIVNHDAAVTDAQGTVWLPYLIQNVDGTVNRLGIIRQDALSNGRLGDAGDYDHATGTTCRQGTVRGVKPVSLSGTN